MEQTRKFPNTTHDVTVVRKKDVLDCIDKNITDKELALEIIKRCEIDCASFLKAGKWASIPFIGNIRIPKTIQLFKDENQIELLNDCSDTLDKEQYVMFKKQLRINNEKRVRHERVFNYTVSIMANRYSSRYKRILNSKGIHAAKIAIFSLSNLNIVNEDHIKEYNHYYGSL